MTRPAMHGAMPGSYGCLTTPSACGDGGGWLAEGETGLASKAHRVPAADSLMRSSIGWPRRCRRARPRTGYFEDQRWTLARVADLIARLFRVRYTLRGVSMLLHRIGFSPQIPKHRPVERDDEAVCPFPIIMATDQGVTWPRQVG
jgi:transposase